jgi:hypothetical protein
MNASLQFTQVDREFEPTIANLFKQAGSSVKIDLREVILLNSQSTMDLFYNAALVSNTCKSTTNMRLKSNGGTMVVTRKATMPGYNKDVWFSTRDITNIIALRNLIQQYRITYDSDDKMCVVHRESQGEPNMEFRMHSVDYTIMIRGTKSILLSSTLFLKTRKVLLRGRSRVPRLQGLFTRLCATRP